MPLEILIQLPSEAAFDFWTARKLGSLMALLALFDCNKSFIINFLSRSAHDYLCKYIIEESHRASRIERPEEGKRKNSIEVITKVCSAPYVSRLLSQMLRISQWRENFRRSWDCGMRGANVYLLIWT